MRVTDVETIVISAPTAEPFWMSLRPIRAASYALVKVHTDEGLIGLGMAGTGARLLTDQSFKGLVIGEDPQMTTHIWHKLFAATHSRESGQHDWPQAGILAAIAAVDTALWDIKARAARQPLYKLLGGYRTEVPAYATGGYYREGKGIPALLDEIQMYVDLGYTAVKIKAAGVPIDADIARIQAIREAFPDLNLMVDGNKGWSVPDAIEFARRAREYGLRWLEEPVHWYDNVQGLAWVRQHTDIPIASGEGTNTLYECRDLIASGAIDILQYDAHRVGGVTEFRKVAALAEAHHIWMAPHHDPQLHVHLLASIPNGLILESFANPARDPLWPELFTTRPQIVKGMMRVPEAPGLGLELNEAIVQRYRVN